MSGYALIYRSIFGHPAFRTDAESLAFAWMVLQAAWKPIRVRYKERIIDLERGQLAISQRDMARKMDRDKTWIERLFKRLTGEAMIEVSAEAGVTVITICNYDKYQLGSSYAEAAGGARAEAFARHTRGREQRRKELGKKKKESSPSEFSLKNDDYFASWQPSEFPPGSDIHRITLAWDEGTRQRELESYKAHCYLRRRRPFDWQAGWEKWVRKFDAFERYDLRAKTAYHRPRSFAQVVLDEAEQRARNQ